MRVQEIDLDEAIQQDGLSSVIGMFTQAPDGGISSELNWSKLGFSPDNPAAALSWYRNHLNSYKGFAAGDSVPVENDAESQQEGDREAAIKLLFGLEKDLQTALREHIQQLEPGLSIIDNNMEQKVNAGFIDILAKDSEERSVVIELKAGTSKPDAIAQILAYMGCVAEEENGPVRGILIAADHHPRVVLAARAIPNLELKRYGNPPQG